jgi:uncharacterized protein Yka (UPF0111/DUF47 family)
VSLAAREHPLARRRSRTDELLALLADAARDTGDVLSLLEIAVHDHPRGDELVAEIRERDGVVNGTTRELLRRLHGRFVVPLEPDDLRSLAHGLSSLCHGAAHIAERLTIFKLPDAREHARRLSHLLVDAAAVLQDAVGQIVAGGRPTDHARRLRDFTQAGEELIRDGLADLYADGPEAALLVAWSDLYEHFATTLTPLDTIADTLDAINPNPEP